MSFVARPNPVAAFMLAVAVPAAAIALGWASMMLVKDGFADRELGTIMLLFFFAALVVSLLAALLIGLPLTLALSSLGLERPWSYQAAGALAGSLIIAAIAFSLDFMNMVGAGLPALLPFGLLPGFLSGEIWWRFNRRHRQ